MNTIDCVLEFHEAFGIPIPGAPGMPAEPEKQAIRIAIKHLQNAQDTLRTAAGTGCRRCLRLSLEVEELRELSEALVAGDMAAALDAQVDRRYIADGTTIELGFRDVFNEAFLRVHRANMAKLGPDGKPIVDEVGKVKKPEGWKAPELGDLVK